MNIYILYNYIWTNSILKPISTIPIYINSRKKLNKYWSIQYPISSSTVCLRVFKLNNWCQTLTVEGSVQLRYLTNRPGLCLTFFRNHHSLKGINLHCLISVKCNLLIIKLDLTPTFALVCHLILSNDQC